MLISPNQSQIWDPVERDFRPGNIGDIAGNLGIPQFNSGTGATGSSFWRGDGVWAIPTAGSIGGIADPGTNGIMVRISPGVAVTIPDETGWLHNNGSGTYIYSAPTKTDVGLPNVTNDAQVKRTEMGVALGVATLDSSGLIPNAQLPPLAITNTFVVASQAAMLALTAEVGDVAVRSDLNKSFILRLAGPGTLSNWQELLTPTDTVLSVFGRTGVVVATTGDYTAAQVTNAADVTVTNTFMGLQILNHASGAGGFDILRMRYNDPDGFGDFNFAQRLVVNTETPDNPAQAGLTDNVTVFGYNVVALGKQVSGEHAFYTALESRYTTSEGKTQLEYYREYINAANTLSFRPFGITIDLDDDLTITRFRGASVNFSYPDNDSGWLDVLSYASGDAKDGDLVFTRESGIVFNAENTRTWKIQNAGIGWLGTYDSKFAVFDLGSGGDSEIVLFAGGNPADSQLRISVGGHLGNFKSLQWEDTNQRWEYEYTDGVFRTFNDELGANQHHFSVTRSLSNTANAYTEVGTVVQENKSGIFEVYVADHQSFTGMKFTVPSNFDIRNGVGWMELVPDISSVRNADDYAVDFHGNTGLLRLRRRGGGGTGPTSVDIVVKLYDGWAGGTFTPSSTTGTGATVGGFYYSTQASQRDGVFQIYNSLQFLGSTSGSVIIQTNSGGSYLDISGGLVPSATDTYDLGSSLKLWRKGWLSELDTILFAQNTQTLVGGWLVLTKNEGVVHVGQDVGAGDTTIDFGQSMTLNDFVVFRASLQVEYVQVGSLVSGTRYNVTRNLDGSGANAWPAGSVYRVDGNTGNGRIELNANATPRISLMRQGATYNAQTEMVRIGDLNGEWGAAASETYGFAVGQYGVAGKSSLRIDDTGIYFYNNTTERIRLLADGSGYLANSSIAWDTSGNLVVTGNAVIAGWTVNSVYFAKDTGTNASSSGMAPVDFPFFAGATYANRATAPFRVTPAGVFSATAGTIAAWTLATTRISSTNVFIDQAGQYISFGATPPTAYGSNVGVFIEGANSGRLSLYKDANNYLQWDNSKLIWKGANTQLDSSGNLTVNAGLIGGWTINSTVIQNSGGTVLLRGAGNLAFGAIPPTSASVGTGLFLDSAGMVGLLSNVVQAKFDAATGGISAGAGNVLIDVNGILLVEGASSGNIVKWSSGGTHIGRIFSQRVGGTDSNLKLQSIAKATDTAGVSYVGIDALNDNGADGGNASFFGLIRYGSAHASQAGKAVSVANVKDGMVIGSGLGSTSIPNAMLDVRGDAVVTGLLKTGSSPTTITDATGKILASALLTTGEPQFLRLGLNQAADATASLALTQSGLGTTSTDGIILQNATTGSAQHSPRIRFSGRAGVSNQAADWVQELASNGNNSNLQFSSRTNGGSYFTVVSYLYNGSAGNVGLNFNSPSGANSNMIYQNAGANVWYAQNLGSNNSYRLLNSDANGNALVLTVFQTGGVTIGSPTGGDKGAGSINAVTVWRNGTALDFVFTSDYNLLSIDEMSAFVSSHHHLPTIPTTHVHDSGSTDLGSLSDRLWETVEVQALYISELHQRLKKLEGQLDFDAAKTNSA